MIELLFYVLGADHYDIITKNSAPIVQRIERRIPNPQMEVRFLLGAVSIKSIFGGSSP